jgi:hypothetical protein
MRRGGSRGRAHQQDDARPGQRHTARPFKACARQGNAAPRRIGLEQKACAGERRVRGWERGCSPRRMDGGSRLESRALSVALVQAELQLGCAVERQGRGDRAAAVIRIEPIHGAAGVVAESQERADPIHAASIATRTGGRRGSQRDSAQPAQRVSPRSTRFKGEMNIPATTYFPRRLPPEYLRRWRA